MPPSPEERVILVDAQDRELGSMEKLAAHREARLHRAFSIFVFDRAGKLLLQRRAPVKYHCPGLWTNTCCGHPRPGETTAGAARRRLGEEMGFGCDLEEKFSLTYRAAFDNGLVEHEYDHVFFGTHDGAVAPDPGEADAWRHERLDAVAAEIERDPAAFTPWFRICLPQVIALRQNSGKAAAAE